MASWNILADSYAFPQRYKYVQPPTAVQWSHRAPKIANIIASVGADIMLLQEVDHPRELELLLNGLGICNHIAYEKRPNRCDGCLTAWSGDRLELVETLRVNFDDLANEDIRRTASGVSRLSRQNVGLVTVFRVKDCLNSGACQHACHLIVANAHFYWSPAAQDVKLLQARHLLYCVAKMKSQFPNSVAIVGGDFNSSPTSPVLRFMQYGTPPKLAPIESFTLDENLYHLTRWLRSLGIDVRRFNCPDLLRNRQALEDFFRECALKNRAIVTTSRHLLKRRGAPRGCMVGAHSRDVEKQFVSIVRQFGADAMNSTERFSRCVKCNGPILPVSRNEVSRREKVGEDKNIPSFVFDSDEKLFRCTGPGACGQVYWWGKGADGTTTTIHRAISLVKRIENLISQTVASCDQNSSCHRVTSQRWTPCVSMKADQLATRLTLLGFKHASAMKTIPNIETKANPGENKDVSATMAARALQEREKIAEGVPSLRRAYPESAHHVTNLTPTFRDVLDHLLVENTEFAHSVHVEDVRRIFSIAANAENAVADEETLLQEIPELPTQNWPSDHLAICASVFLSFYTSSGGD